MTEIEGIAKRLIVRAAEGTLSEYHIAQEHYDVWRDAMKLLHNIKTTSISDTDRNERIQQFRTKFGFPYSTELYDLCK